VTSPALLDELGRVLEYRRLAQVLTKTGMTAHALVDLVAAVSTVVTPSQSVAAARDASDNRVLEVALAGDAEMVVSGDDDLLALRTFEGVPIVTPTEVLKRISRLR
jgi:putative PIN family toxin of toxin-antitoxin system